MIGFQFLIVNSLDAYLIVTIWVWVSRMQWLNFFHILEFLLISLFCVITANMHLYSEEHIVYGDYAFEEWDPELVADLIDRVNPYNMRLDVVTKNFDKNSAGNTLCCSIHRGVWKLSLMFMFSHM